MITLIRSCLFWLLFGLWSMFLGLISPLIIPLSYERAYKILLPWVKVGIFLAKHVLGINYRIDGLEHLHKAVAEGKNGIFISNHQSTWETLLIPYIVPKVSWVLKKELLSMPFFGWALARIKPIAIDRASSEKSRDQVVRIGTERLNEGQWISIFPEGTRVALGSKVRYKPGAAILAKASQYPVFCMAHNAGTVWPRKAFLIGSGFINVHISEPFDPSDMSHDEISQKLKDWVDLHFPADS